MAVDLVAMTKESSADFIQRFFSRFEDPAIFDCGQVNLLKVAQSGLFVRYPWLPEFEMNPGKLDKLFFQRRMKARFRRISNPFSAVDLQALAGRKFLFLDNNMAVLNEEDKPVSLCFHRICEAFDREEYVLGLMSTTPSDLEFDFQSSEFQYQHFFLKVTKTHADMLEEIYETLQVVQEKADFTPEELAQIQGAFYLYWASFRVWDHILSQLKPARVLFIAHYHNEGLIRAMRHHQIEGWELQRGLIAKEDVFYVYPEQIRAIRERALFADKILTYGPHWSEILKQGYEYPADSIEEAGYYLYSNFEANPELQAEIKALGDEKTRFLLITGQKFLHPFFNNYIHWLAQDIKQKGQNAIILFRPHRDSEPQTYKQLEDLPGVRIVTRSQLELLQVADLHLSIFSNMLYEAVRFGIPNYCLYVPECASYVDKIIQAGVAEKIEMNENPFDKPMDQVTSRHPAEHYFAPFQPEVLKTGI